MLVPIQLPPGLTRGATPYDAPGRWWDSNLVRWQEGVLHPIGGWERNTATPLDSAVRKIHIWRDNVATRHILAGTDGKLYADVDGFLDITPGDIATLDSVGTDGGYGTFNYGEEDYGDARSESSPIFDAYAFWSMANWGQDVILTNNADGRLFYYDVEEPDEPPTPITATAGSTPTGVTSVIVTDERHVMLIGAGAASTVSWSSREDYTDWDFASTTNTAGTISLDVRSPLVTAVRVREGILIFSQSEVFLARYVGLPFVYGFERLASTSLLNPNSICTFNGRAAWQGKKSFWVYDGGFVKPLDCPILDDIVMGADAVYSAFRGHGGHNGMYPELWWWYASAGQTECDKLVIYNYAENWWSRSDLARSAFGPAEAFKLPYAGKSDGNVFVHESGWTDAGVSRVGSVWAESSALAIANGDKGMEIVQAHPASGQGATSTKLTFYSRRTPEGAERAFGPYTPRSDGYCDIRVSGRDVRVRVEATADGEWSIGKMRLDVAQGEGR